MGIYEDLGAGGDCEGCAGRWVGIEGADNWVGLDGALWLIGKGCLGKDVVLPIHSTMPVNMMAIRNYSSYGISEVAFKNK